MFSQEHWLGSPGHLKEARILETLDTLRGLQGRKVENQESIFTAWQKRKEDPGGKQVSCFEENVL